MSQKDKVKELVGRGLGSYHTKALQQIDRIEKKNKEQNHKISILTNELDNDYLTKTEEGSVVSLEHSKEGMIYLDELQGNTMVNYVTDGAKELTLNGDIDIEGTSVTLTEGVDNGKVDVVCEGNTLVNLYENKQKTFHADYVYCVNERVNLDRFVEGREYTAIILNGTTNFSSFRICTGDTKYDLVPSTRETIKKFTYTPPTDSSINRNDIRCYCYPNLNKFSQGDEDKIKILILEGDWTNKEIPPHFEGMKSVGECENNKFEILSTSSMPNLLLNSRNFKGLTEGTDTGSYQVDYIIENGEEFTRFTTNKEAHCNHYWYIKPTEPRRANETYTISFDYRCSKNWNGYWYPSDSFAGAFFPNTNNQWKRGYITKTLTTNSDSSTILFGVSSGGSIGDTIDIKNIKLEKGSTPTRWLPNVNDTEYTLAKYTNKKEISLNEPLRGFENGKKDRFIKINNKWFIERNCGMRSSTEFSWQESGRQFENHYCVFVNGLGCKKDSKYLSTSYPYISDAYATYLDASYISNNSNTGYDLITLTIPKSKLTTVNIVGAREYLNNNPFDFMVELATPTYEEITDVELITYLDTTHISNNSTIPCNMKIQNSGYNAIIKPSTLYTVALDTDESGTIGLNLGGAKVTTTNNVATITTPATLVDDSLRLHGKGIKASNVRLLEGDKTNCVPSYFEGMKSSFEDKLQDDGTFKMEILSNNRNLSVVNNYSHTFDNGITNSQKGSVIVKNIRVEPNTTYYISCSSFTSGFHCFQAITSKEKINVDNHVDAYHQRSRELNVLNTRIMTNDNEKYITLTTGNWECTGNNNKFEIKDLMLEKADSKNEYVPNEQNKIQFSSIEPLRGIGDVKDRFVFKDSKLMIERNCGEIVLNGSEGDKAVVANGSWFKSSIEGMASVFVLYNTPKKIGYNTSICERFTNTYNANPFSSGKIKSFTYTDHPTLNTMYFDYGDNPNVTVKEFCEWLSENPTKVVYQLAEPTYEEIPFELQKIILECFENGTLFIDTNIPPTVTTTYSGETPIVKSVRLNKTEVSNNTTDINDNIVPYLMDMDFRVVCLQLEGGIENVSVARLFGGTYEMLQRDILSNRYSKEEYKYRLDTYLSANKITHEEYKKLGDMLNE